MKLRELIEAVNNFTEIEVLERDKKSAKIYLKEYDFTYNLNFYDWYLVEALQIIFNAEVNHANKYDFTTEDIKIFSANDLLELRDAIREDHNHFGGIYRDYFYQIPDFRTLKNKVNKQYVWDYIQFINRVSGYEK
jgi:DNA-directed RNA polymerase subunit L